MLDTLERHSAGTRVAGLKAEDLGDESFRRDHRLRYAYAAGAMANGIASTRLVAEMARAGMLSFFGAAGLGVERIESAIDARCRARRTAST
jgi:trans-AT polyketide synthase/acyltransferase/oxidoreductase domain-containing protein